MNGNTKNKIILKTYIIVICTLELMKDCKVESNKLEIFKIV